MNKPTTLISSAIIFTIALFVLFSCEKEKPPDAPNNSNKIEFCNTTIDSVSYLWVQLTTEFTNTGGNEIPQHGYCWSTEQEPTIEDDKIELGSLDNPGNFQTTIDSLTNNTNYYIRLFLAYYGSILYGDELNIKTLKTGIPIVLTSEVSEITLVSAHCGGTVIADSGLIIITRGICWDTINEFNIDDCLNKTINGDSLGSFTSNITELSEGKDYFVKAYATNEKGTAYGDIKTFSTIPLSVPEVQTSNINEITTTSAVGGGEVINNGNGTITARGICWSTSDNVSLENNIGFTENGTEIGSFISNLTDLTDGTIYYVVAYSTNEKGTGYGQMKSFQTVAIGAPTVITSEVTDITTISAQCGGNVTNSGNGTVTARGVCWNTTGNPTLQNCLDYTENGIGLGSFNSSLTELTEGTTYFVSAYATNEVGTAYGISKSFETTPITLAVVLTLQVTNIQANSAQCDGNVTNNGNSTVSARGICWSDSPNPSITNCIGSTVNGSGLGNFTGYLTNLDENTTYYVVAYAINEIGAAYGETINFSTLELNLPGVITAEISNITINSAECGGEVINNGNGTVISRGVCWDTTSSPTLSNCINYTTNGSGIGAFSSLLLSLEENTYYYISAYATNEKGTSYGIIRSFCTLELILPEVMTANITNITYNSAECGGEVMSNGNGNILVRGVCWNTTGNPTLDNCHNYTTDGTGIGTYVSYLTDLIPNTEYYVAAYVTNEIGTNYGNINSFFTNQLSFGDYFAGGIIFYLDGNGGGMVCPEYDQSSGAVWGCYGYTIGGTSTGIGTGDDNTTAIVADCAESGIAALICNELVLNGYEDWFLPSKDELNLMYTNMHAVGIGGFEGYSYWSSSEAGSNYAWKQHFSDGTQYTAIKGNYLSVRAARTF